MENLVATLLGDLLEGPNGVSLMVDVEDEDDIKVKGSGSQSVASSIRRWALLCAALLVPAGLLVGAVCVLWGVERRRVRTGWWLGWAALAAVIGFAVEGSLRAWLVSPLQLHGWLLHAVSGRSVLPDRPGGHGGVGEVLSQIGGAGTADAIAGQLLFGVPIALLCTAAYVLLRRYERQQLGQLEGDEYSNHRPIGVLDRLRAQRTTVKIRRGDYTAAHATTPGDGIAAVGVGKYGAPALLAMRFLVVAAIVLGGPRTGKTRLANSISSQQVRALGGGALILDFKGGDDIPAYWAQVALEEHRNFYHFSLNEKAGGQYRQPHPYAAPAPAFYDPLVRGNGDSKTSMLLNSIDREGDAAAYLRTAEDVVQLAFDIADLTGLSVGKGGLETLANMLDLSVLERQANKLTVEAVVRAHPHMSAVDAQRRVNDLQERVHKIVSNSAKNDLLRGAIGDTQTQVSKFANSSALGGRLRPGHGPSDTIDLVRAVLRGEIVVFSLPTNDYRTLSVLVATMVLLDLQNTVSTLRRNILDVRKILGDTSTTADATPWKPFIVQVEELGSAKSPAAAAALLGVVNKSSNEGFRTTVSSQGWSDLVAVDGTGVWANQMLESTFNVYCFQLGPADDDAVLTAYSGQVDKTRPRVKTIVDTGGRWRWRSGAKSLNAGVTDSVRESRVPAGTLQGLASDARTDLREFVWITKTPALAATHTVAEGPNSWVETLRLVTVKEPPNRYNPFSDPEAVAHAEAMRAEITAALEQSLRADPVLAHVLSADAAANLEPVDHLDAAPLLAAAEDPWSASRSPTASPVGGKPLLDVGVAVHPDIADADAWDDWGDDWPAPEGIFGQQKSAAEAVENLPHLIGRDTTAAADGDYIDATDL